MATIIFLKWTLSFVLMVATMTTGINADTAYGCSPRKFTYGTVCVCNATYCDRTPDPKALPKGKYVLYTSSNTGSRLHRSDGMFVQSLDSQWSGDEINVDEGTTYQIIHGFGGAFTDSAGINILSLSPNTQQNLLKSYFADDGIKYNIGRVPIGGTDFSTHKYTYDDQPGSPALKNFKLATEDYTYKIPLIKTAMEISSQEVKLIGTAWSAPPWMKTNNDYTGTGFLKPSFMDTWAKYHLAFLDAYQEKNLTFWAITTGNEPTNGVTPVNMINSMGWIPSSQSKWIGRFMGPQLRASDHNSTLLFTIDDQRSVLPWWMKMLMSDELCAKYIDGIALHWYLDIVVSVKALNEVHEDFGDKIIINTEASQGGKWEMVKVHLGSWTRAENYIKDIIDDLNNWVQGWLEWNLALDKTGGPSWVPNFIDSPVIVDKTTDEFYKQPTFYAIGHFSKFISRGSVRIKLTQSSVIKSVGFKRPDGAVVIVLYNGRNKPVHVAIKDSERGVIGLVLQKKSVNTLLYW